MANNGHRVGAIPQDYHVHTVASCDSKVTMAEHCRQALALGLKEIAFTDHFDPMPADLCFGHYDPAPYFEALEVARSEFGPQGLVVRAGVELGEYHRYHGEIRPVLEQWPYDFVLGSIHWVGERTVFDQTYYTEQDPFEAVADYYREMETLARFGGFDVLSHADVVKRVGFHHLGGFDVRRWEDLVRPMLAACIDNGIGIEINTSGLRYKASEVHPDPQVVRWYREMGGEILTVGSDSHRVDHLGTGFDRALAIAREAGFTRIASFERRQVVGWHDLG